MEKHEPVARCGGWPSRLAYLGFVRDVSEQGRLDYTFVDALCEPAGLHLVGIRPVLTFAAIAGRSSRAR